MASHQNIVSSIVIIRFEVVAKEFRVYPSEDYAPEQESNRDPT